MGYLKVANDKSSDWLLQAVIIKFFEAKKFTSINVILLHFGEKKAPPPISIIVFDGSYVQNFASLEAIKFDCLFLIIFLRCFDL